MITVRSIDQDDSRRRRLLNIILLGLTVVTLLTGILALFNPAAAPLLWLVSLILLVSNTLIYLINRFISGALAAIIFILLLSLVIIFGDLPEQVVEGRTLFFLCIPIMAAGIVLRPYAGFAIAFVLSIILTYVSITADLPVNYVAYLGFFTVALITWLSANTMERALRDLRGINEELDDRVEQRTQELAAANERLLELDRLKSKFVSDVSHELRTPVSNLTIYLEMLRSGSDERKSQRYLSVLQEETERLANLVTDVLDLSKIDLSTIQPTFDHIELNEVVKQAIRASQLQAEASGLTLETHLTEGLEPILGNSDQIRLVVNNLLSNAINYTQTGSIILRTYVNSEGLVVIEVEDSGLGIPEEDQPHIFERFYRGRIASQSNIPGSGLGLAIVKEIVSNHGGVIRLESTNDQGSCFSVAFPARSP